jgi:hypothetical protein
LRSQISLDGTKHIGIIIDRQQNGFCHDCSQPLLRTRTCFTNGLKGRDFQSRRSEPEKHAGFSP